MFDAVRKFQTPAKILLGLIALTFVGFTASSYDGMGSPYIVKVGNQEIAENDLKQELERSQIPANDETRQAILNRLMDQAYLTEGLSQMGLAISVQQAKDAILSEPSFQENGTFSKVKYEAYLKGQNVNEDTLVQSLQKQFAMQSFIGTLQAGSVFSDSQINQVISLFAATHIARSAMINPADYTSKVEVTDAALQKFYQSRKAGFLVPEAAKIEYIELSVAALAEKQTVSEDEAKKYFESNAKQYAKAERDVAHILIKFPDGADAAAKAKTKAEAQKVLTEVQANPKQFAELAKKYSQDTVSAENGGSLGFFVQDGTMVKPFEDAAFALKPDQISGLVETQYGYHILKLLSVKDAPKFADIKDQIIAQVKQEKASKAFNAQVDKLAESVFLNSKELNTTAKELGLTVGQMDDWLSKESAAQAKLPEKLITTIFSDEVLKNKHNSEPVDLGNQTVMVVRVKETRPARTIDFAEAKPELEKDFVAEEALKLAKEDAKTILAKLKKGEQVNLNWDKEPLALTAQMATSIMPQETYKELISLRVSKDKPGYVMVNLDKAPPVLIKVEDVQVPERNEQLIAGIRGQLQQLQVNALLDEYVKILKQNIKQKAGQQKLTDSNS